MDRRLLDFTRHALAAGVSRQEIADALRRADWSEAEIGAALSSYAELDFPVPVPRARPYLSAREVFIYLVLFAALYTAAYNTGSLFFRLIEIAFPSQITNTSSLNQYFLSAIRWNISAIVVALPLFLVLFRHIGKAIAKDQTKRESRPRVWLTYLTLFVTGLWLAGDIMAVIYNALGGELGARLLLKVLTVAVIAGGLFTYFLLDVRSDKSS